MNELAECIHAYALLLHQRLGGDPRRTAEFERLILAAARSADRYADVRSALSGGGNPRVHLMDCRNHVGAFLARNHFDEHPPLEPPDARRLAEAMLIELGRDHCTVTSLILLDGLELPAEEIVFTGGRLFELDETLLRLWCGGASPPGSIPASRIDGVAAMEVTRAAASPPWGPTLIEWESDAALAKRTALPWLTYLNLFDAGKCSVVGMYQHSDSQLHQDEWRAVGVEEPMWEPRHGSDGENDYEYEELYRTLQLDDADAMRSFLDALETGRRVAAQNTHRVETALRFFDRVSDGYMSEHLLAHGDNMDVNEDLVIDAVAGLEAIFLADEKRGKGQAIAMRATAILEYDVGLQRRLRKQAIELYELRSAILHGDARAESVDLRNGAINGERLLRRSLAAFCRLGGDHRRVVDAAGTPAVAEAVRRALSA
jgi:hypothetical protein